MHCSSPPSILALPGYPEFFTFFHPNSSTSSTPRDKSYKGHCILFPDAFIPVFTEKAKELSAHGSSKDTFTDSMGTSMFENPAL